MSKTPPPPGAPSWPVVPPVVLSSTFAFPDAEGVARAAHEQHAHLYTRWSNPSQEAVEARVAALEGAERALVCGSGMAAIALGLLAATRRGGPLLVQREVYGGTHQLVEHLLPSLGVEVRRAAIDDLVAAAGALPGGSTIHLEIPANPTVRVCDIEAIRAAAPDDAAITVDATFATPILFRPLRHGADLSIHSATKYFSGHHDVLAGAIAGAGPLMDEAGRLRLLLGPVLDPAAAYRLWRGMETLELRVLRQNDTAWTLAQRLVEHPRVAGVHHPFLPGHRDEAVARRLLRGAGGVLSFEVAGGDEKAAAVANRLARFDHAPSLGGVRSLVTWPAGVSHHALSAEERRHSGLPSGLLRLALGIEPVEELWADLEQALGS